MIDAYLVTDTAWKRRKDGGFRETEYEAPQTIKTRWFPKTQQVSNEAGQMIGSDTVVQTKADVQIGDLLTEANGDEWPVISVAEYLDLGGEVQFYEAYL